MAFVGAGGIWICRSGEFLHTNYDGTQAGFDAAKARELFRIPERHTPMAMIAVGYPGRIKELPEALQEDAERLEPLEGVKAYPTRVKCATLAWHALRAALRGEEQAVSTE